MRSAFFYILVISVASVFSQQPFVRYTGNLRKAVPPHYNHDQKNADWGVDKIARGHKVEARQSQPKPRQPPLRPQPDVPWLKWVHEGRWAAQADKNTELLKVRARLLEEKLKPNRFAFKPVVNPQLKPKLGKKGNVRVKREVENSKVETVKEETKIKEHVIRKREVMKSEQTLGVNTRQKVEVKMPADEINEEMGKRKKRQIIYFINRPSQQLARSPRTTPNPFIRDTNIEEYDIIRPEVGEREGMIPTVESGSSDPGSYPLMNEESSEFSKIIAQFCLLTSDEHWPAILRFADNILKPLSQPRLKKMESTEVLKSMENSRRRKVPFDVIESYEKPPVNEDIEEVSYKRIKRRVNKTLQRKRAKKKKQRLRRFERKRLRMLTHARRVRRQQKAKQARLQRHYARMNMSTTATPEHLRNRTEVGEDRDHDEDQTKSEDEEDEEQTDEEDEEYESSEYEDESEKSESDSKDDGKTSRDDQKDSEESDENYSEESEIGGKPDYGNDDYEEYEDDSDEDYEDSSDEEVDRKKKEIGRGKKLKAATKSGRKLYTKMLSTDKYNRGREKHRTNPKETSVNRLKPHFLIKNPQENIILNKQTHHKEFKVSKELSFRKQAFTPHHERKKLNGQYFRVNMANKR